LGPGVRRLTPFAWGWVYAADFGKAKTSIFGKNSPFLPQIGPILPKKAHKMGILRRGRPMNLSGYRGMPKPGNSQRFDLARSCLIRLTAIPAFWAKNRVFCQKKALFGAKKP
jgi:hypothetical protein